jgi:hypothetical protein
VWFRELIEDVLPKGIESIHVLIDLPSYILKRNISYLSAALAKAKNNDIVDGFDFIG